MDDLCKSAHKVFKIKYHFVFCIKYRKDLFLENKYVEFVKKICNGLEERYSMKFESVGFDEDHVHFLLQSVPKYAPSQVFRIVKVLQLSSCLNNILILRRIMVWRILGDGGYVGTVGEGNKCGYYQKLHKTKGKTSS